MSPIFLDLVTFELACNLEAALVVLYWQIALTFPVWL